MLPPLGETEAKPVKNPSLPFGVYVNSKLFPMPVGYVVDKLIVLDRVG